MQMEDWVPPNVSNLLVQELSLKCETASFVAETLPQLSPDTVLDDPDFWGVVLWVAGGYNFTISGSTSLNPCTFGAQVMLHVYAGALDRAWDRAHAVVSILNAPTEERRAARVLSGPYDNPHPAHPYISRVSTQWELVVYNTYKAIEV